MKKLFNYFLQGLLLIAPIGITVYIIYVTFKFIDDIVQEWLKELLSINIPGLGFIVIIALLILVGLFGQTIIAKPFKYLINRLMDRAPLVKVIYTAINDLFSAFVGKERKFNKPVLVQLNINSNIQKLGFLTEDDLMFMDEKDKVAVYFPHSYAFSGELFIVPKSQVRSIDIPPAEAMKFIVSAGVTSLNNAK